MSLLDDSSGLVDGFGVEGILGNSSLQSAVQELVKSQTQNVIELKFLIGEETIPVHSSKKGSTFE